MLSLVASQSALLKRAAVAPVVLVHLECFSNYGSGTVAENYYWTKAPGCRYIWGGVARSFDPVILRLSPIVAAMDHVPNGGHVDTRRTVVELVLANIVNGAAQAPLWQELRGRNLAFARVTIATLLVESQRRAAAEHGGANDLTGRRRRYFDLSDYAGDEHVVRFRGELTAVGVVTATQIPLTFEIREPELDWPINADMTDAHPTDLGKRYPLALGDSPGVHCARWAAVYPSSPGAFTLDVGINNSVVGIDLNLSGSIAGWPIAWSAANYNPPLHMWVAHYVQIDSEIIEVALGGTTPDDYVTIVNRARIGTTAAAHSAGATVSFWGWEASTVSQGDPIESPGLAYLPADPQVVIVNSAPSFAVDAIYVQKPSSGDTGVLLQLHSSLYTVNLNNTTLEPGRALTTIAVDLSDVIGIRNSLGDNVDYELDYVADVRGAKIPGSGYKAATNALIEHPADVIKWIVESRGAGTVDVTDDPSALGDYKIAGDLRELGETFGEILAGLSFASRLSIVPRYSTTSVRYLLRGPDASFGFGSAQRTLSDLADVQESRKNALERPTRFLALYDFRPWETDGGIEGYHGLLRIGSNVNDLGTTLDAEIDAAELERGVRVAERITFPLVADRDTIEKVMAYYAHEALADRARIAAKVPWVDGYDLELGDVVSVTPLWSATAIKARVVMVPFDDSAASIGIALEEVE